MGPSNPCSSEYLPQFQSHHLCHQRPAFPGVAPDRDGMQMLEGVEIALIHGHAFVHEDFAHKVTIVTTNYVRTIRGHVSRGKGGAPSLLHCTYLCTRVVDLRVNANLAYVSWGLQKSRGGTMLRESGYRAPMMRALISFSQMIFPGSIDSTPTCPAWEVPA
jgi:hypothetical protein